jgi:FAD/FMN-containing dehydrogenase
MSMARSIGTRRVMRRSAWSLLNVPGIWESAADDESEIAWVRRTFAALEPHTTGGKYVNFMGEDEAAPDAYVFTLNQLQTVKRRYDPDNVFRLNQNIAP